MDTLMTVFSTILHLRRQPGTTTYAKDYIFQEIIDLHI